MKLVVVGCGNMGTAIVNALSGEAIFDDIEVYDRRGTQCENLKEVTVLDSLDDAFIDEETVILLAVKPQDLEGVFDQLKGRLIKGTLLISIAAGVSLDRLQSGTDCSAVVRVMPNLPATIGQGASAWFASSTVTETHRGVVRDLLSSFGMEMEVHSEDDIDKVTALSGSGPAYVFYFLEALTEAGENLGLSSGQAGRFALQTLIGGAEMARKVTSLAELKQLRATVTSKGGTTERALAVLEKRAFKSIVNEAIQAAYARTKEL